MRDSVWLDRYNAVVRERDHLRAQLAQCTAALRLIADRIEDAVLYYGAARLVPSTALTVRDIARRALADLPGAPKRCHECQGGHAPNPYHPHIDCWCPICHPPKGEP